MSRPMPPPTLAADLSRLTARELSLPSRLRYLALLLSSSVMTTIALALLITESGLPTRTFAALGAVAAIGGVWVAFSIWVLTYRRPLMGRHRIIAARLAVVFCAGFLCGCVWVGLSIGAPAAFGAAALASGMLAIAIGGLVRANRQLARLVRRRDELVRRER
jgi:hypothetical protein